MSDGKSECVSDRMLGYLSDRMSESMSDRISERLSGRMSGLMSDCQIQVFYVRYRR